MEKSSELFFLTEAQFEMLIKYFDLNTYHLGDWGKYVPVLELYLALGKFKLCMYEDSYWATEIIFIS